jgi:CelD/BcsL family acetyltransferase involved in cellulose biosynthesis
VLRLNGKPAGCLYGFLYGGKFYYYQSGFDPAYEKYSPGMIVFGLSIQAAIEEGAYEFDLLHGDESYKSRWTGLRRDLTRVELFPPGLAGRLFQVSVGLIRKHRRVVPSVQRNSQRNPRPLSSFARLE